MPLALLVGQQMLAPRTMKVFRASEGDIASATVRGYAAEAYPAYRAAAPTRPCPASLDELDGGTRAHRDPWGTPYAMDCTRDRIVVVSAGPDGMFDTDDDIGSNQ